jgi:hypothetical protein
VYLYLFTKRCSIHILFFFFLFYLYFMHWAFVCAAPQIWLIHLFLWWPRFVFLVDLYDSSYCGKWLWSIHEIWLNQLYTYTKGSFDVFILTLSQANWAFKSFPVHIIKGCMNNFPSIKTTYSQNTFNFVQNDSSFQFKSSCNSVTIQQRPIALKNKLYLFIYFLHEITQRAGDGQSDIDVVSHQGQSKS